MTWILFNFDSLNRKLQFIGTQGDYRENNWFISMWNIGQNLIYIHAEKTYGSLSKHTDKLEAASLPFNAGVNVDLPLFGKVGSDIVRDVVGYAHFIGGQGSSKDKTGMWVSASDYSAPVTIFTFGYIPIINT